MTARPERRLVAIDWLDSSESHGWVRLDEIRREPLDCHSVGYIVAEDERSVTISSTVADGNGADEQWSSPLTIPCEAIVSRHEIVHPGPEK